LTATRKFEKLTAKRTNIKYMRTIKVGTVFTHPTLGNVKVVAIHALGTIDVKNIFTGRHYRISGLPMN